MWKNRFQVTVFREAGLRETDSLSDGVLAWGHRIQDGHLLAQREADHGHDAFAGRTPTGVALQGVPEAFDDRSERIHKRSVQIEENRSDPSRGRGGSHTCPKYGRFALGSPGTAAASWRIPLKIAGLMPMMFLARLRTGSAHGRGQLCSIDRPRRGSERQDGRSGVLRGGRLRGDPPFGASATWGTLPDGGGRRGRGGRGQGAECSAAGTGPQPRGEDAKDPEAVRHRPGRSRSLGGHPTSGAAERGSGGAFRGWCDPNLARRGESRSRRQSRCLPGRSRGGEPGRRFGADRRSEEA